MGRQMPVECEHGVIVDGGDFASTDICEACDMGESFGESPTLRDQFAMAALQGLIAHASGESPHKAPEVAYVIADAMLKARGESLADGEGE